jgi:hypothetical protein
MATPKTPHARVIGRLFWDASHPSPWMTFDHKTAFHRWAAEVRKARPGTKTEWHYIDLVWTADAMLRQIQQDAKDLAA